MKSSLTAATMRFLPLLGAMLVFPALSGCTSIARGVTEAVIESRSDTVDNRRCEIEGPRFEGIAQSLGSQTAHDGKVTKVLMVHGINNHVPGYSRRFQKKLFDTLGLNVTDSALKTIALDTTSIQWGADEPHNLGTLRISRHVNDDNSKTLVFYELTWSSITEHQKVFLAADSANNAGLKRAGLNSSLKAFLNATVPDLLIYNGNGRERINASVAQSVCWMLSGDWEALPTGGAYKCEDWDNMNFDGLVHNDHFFVTHSLGSHITIDTIHNFADRPHTMENEAHRQAIAQRVRDKNFTVFMMSNQLPLLEIGRDNPRLASTRSDYCSANAPQYSKRVMKQMNIVAFSDPNDILSYPVPPDFAETSIDARICPVVTNVSLNVAAERNLFDAAAFANPLSAHSGYMDDDRVIALIAHGIQRHNRDPMIAERCRWLETLEGPVKKKSQTPSS